MRMTAISKTKKGSSTDTDPCGIPISLISIPTPLYNGIKRPCNS